MKIHLNLIESRLRMLIEEWVVPFNRGDFQNRLAHQLVDAMQDHIYTGDDGQAFVPAQYIIRISPILVDELQGSDVLTHLPDALEQAAQENGLLFSSTPVIRLEADHSYGLEDIYVRALPELISPGNTASLSLKNLPGNRLSTGELQVSAYLIVNGSRIFPLKHSVINLGRRPDNHLVLDDPRVSRVHAQLRYNRGQFILFDLNSTGGTTVNGQRIHQQTLKPGDVISLAGAALIYGEEPKADEGSSDTTRLPNSFTPPPEIIG
jgi:pSer/pThr/pTyr-binding forkhead associated (FHA) protein